MARNIFSLSFVLSPEVLTIKETAIKIISLLDILRSYDEVFSKFTYSKLDFPRTDFNLTKDDLNELVDKLSDTMLSMNLSDIQQYNNVINPIINFGRDFGFSFLLDFDDTSKKHFSITGNISSSKFSSFSIKHFPFENSDYDFDWYFSVLKLINMNLRPLYSGVKITIEQYMDLYLPLKIKYPLGWITYFSDDSKIKTPDDIGFEVLKVEGGCYIIATRNDFTQSKEEFLEIKDKLIEATKKLKKYSPEYSEG
ncbi:hypothetical protein [Sphingobacterium sp. xlx-130]|uniref:hypothetical protein n=1 Tax=Sphingobacterium sp. xlx-130 TaxID=2654323 RepID=UPI0013DCD571|nr:hypothetical protein [Sphingobacterium sp. xlx-130]